LASLERGRVPSPRPIAPKEVPLVDRTEEMEVLKEAVYKAVHGEGGLVFIHGEAGIGKTRLLRELGAYARSRGVQVLYGRCPALFRMDGVPPYTIWKEVVRDYLDDCTPEQLHRVIGFYPAEIAKLVPEVSQKLRSIPQSLPISPEQEQNRLFEAVSQFITNVSSDTPLLVVLDDLQWTDPSSLFLLHYLVRGVQKTSLLLLGAYRSTDVDAKHPLTPVLMELKRESSPQIFSLKRMSLQDTSELIRQILEQDEVPPGFCKTVYEKTRGNPFFTLEVIESLKEEEIIHREENKWKIKEISEIEFPETVKNILKARLGRLDEDCMNVLTMASFVGNDFTFEAVSTVTGIEEDKLLKLMDKLFKTGLIKERVIHGEGVCSFADILVRDVVYEEVSPLTRKSLHGVVGCALEKVYAKTIDEHSGELASHFLESGDKDKALDYFLKAGDRAMKVYANSEAASYFHSALRLLEEKGDRLQEKERVLELLGDIKRLVGEYDTSMKCWSDASLLWKQLNEKETMARLHRKMASVSWLNMGDTKKAKEHHEAAFKILETEPESVELASLYEDMAGMVAMGATGNMLEALSLGEKAVELAKKLNAHQVMANSYMWLGEISEWLGDGKKGVECFERALRIALDNSYTETAAWAYDDLAHNIPAEENEKRQEFLEKAFALAKKVGTVDWIALISLHLAHSYLGMGELNKAITMAEESASLNRKVGNKIQLAWSLSWLGIFYEISGETVKSLQCCTEAVSISKGLDDFQAILVAFVSLGWLHYRRGDYAEARELMEKGQETVEKHGVKMRETVQWITRNYVELGELEKAKSLIDSLQEFALEAKHRNFVAHVYALRGAFLRAQRKWEESIEQFEKSLQEFEALGARQWNVYNLADYVLYENARVYLERNREGDREKALSLLGQALEIFQKMGAKKDVEKVEAKIALIETGKVVLKAKSTDHVSTGYEELDKLLQGGLPPNYAVVLTSLPCDEKDLLIQSFLEAGSKKGEPTFYVTIDASGAKALAEKSASNLQLFVCNPEADAIIKDLPNVVKLKGVENLTDISIALTSAIRGLTSSLSTPRRICIGLVSDVLLQHHAVETRRWLTALMTKLKSERFTTLAVMNPQMHPSQEFQAILDLFDGEINIYEKETQKGPRKYLKIQKMSNQKYLEDELPMRKEQP